MLDIVHISFEPLASIQYLASQQAAIFCKTPGISIKKASPNWTGRKDTRIAGKGFEKATLMTIRGIESFIKHSDRCNIILNVLWYPYCAKSNLSL